MGLFVYIHTNVQVCTCEYDRDFLSIPSFVQVSPESMGFLFHSSPMYTETTDTGNHQFFTSGGNTHFLHMGFLFN